MPASPSSKEAPPDSLSSSAPALLHGPMHKGISARRVGERLQPDPENRHELRILVAPDDAGSYVVAGPERASAPALAAAAFRTFGRFMRRSFWPLLRRRSLVASASRIASRRGTRPGLRQRRERLLDVVHVV